MSVPTAAAARRGSPGTCDNVITAFSSTAGRDVNAPNEQFQQLDLHHDIEQGIVAPQPELNSGPLSYGMAGSTHDAAHLYDAVGAIWLQLFGSHVHVGFYEDLAQRSSRRWQDAQLDHIDAVLAAAGLKTVHKVLDLGCGYGGTAIHIARRLHCKALGMNISPYQVASANELALRQGFKPQEVAFVVGDAMAPALPDSSFDLVISVEAAAYMTDKSQFVQEMSRMVTPGGTVVLVDFCRRDGPISQPLKQRLKNMDEIFATGGNWHSANEYKKLMESNGLSVVKDSNWTKHIYGFWNMSLFRLLYRNSNPKQSFWAWQWEVFLRMLACLWLMLTGGLAVLSMATTFLLGRQKRVVQGGLDNGMLEYHVIVARKPMAELGTAVHPGSAASQRNLDASRPLGEGGSSAGGSVESAGEATTAEVLLR
eukprot:gene11945-12088_t